MVDRKTIQQIRNHLDWRSAFLGSTEDGMHIRCVYPERHANGDRTPSMAIYPDGAYCYGCAATFSDPLNFYATLNPDAGFNKTVQVLWASMQGHGVRGEKKEKVYDRTSVSACLVNKWQQAMTDEHYGWLEENYAISNHVAKSVNLGFTGTAIAIPLGTVDDIVWDVKFRRFDPVSNSRLKYWTLPNRCGPSLYPGRWLNKYEVSPPPTLVICEGELDTLSALSNDNDALGVTQGVDTPLNGDELLNFWKGLAKAQTKVLICFDNDSPGRQAAGKNIAYLKSCGIDARIIKLPKQYKDISEYYVGGT